MTTYYLNDSDTEVTSEMILLEAERQLDKYKAALERIRDNDWRLIGERPDWARLFAKEVLENMALDKLTSTA
jgi:hypothetical protein